MAVRFDGSTDALSRTANLPPLTCTIMAWFYISADRGATANFLAHGDSSGSVYAQYGIDQSGAVNQSFIWPGATDSTNGSQLPSTTWIHLALVMRGSGATCLGYYNGNLDITTVHNLGAGMTASKVYIGNDNDAEWLSGRAAYVGIWDRILSTNEIQAQMWSPVPVVGRESLNSWHDLWLHGQAEAVYDRCGKVRGWTAGGTLTTEDGPPFLLPAPYVMWPKRRQTWLFNELAEAPAEAVKARSLLTMGCGC